MKKPGYRTAAVAAAVVLAATGCSHSAPEPSTAADGCFTLHEMLAQAVAAGDSVITARGRRTGRTGVDGYPYVEQSLAGITTIAGPPLADGAKPWVLAPDHPGGSDPAVVDAGPGDPLWGPEGALLGVYTPHAGGPLGPRLLQVPVVGDRVILTATGCWGAFSAQGLDGAPFTGPLTEIPGSGGHDRMARRGFVSVPLSAVTP